MTASQLKRIRAKLAKARELTDEAYALAQEGFADSSLREITAGAATNMVLTARELEQWDDRMAMHAAAIVQDIASSEEGKDT